MLPFWRRPPLYDTANIKGPVLLSPLYLYSASILLESEQHANQTIHQPLKMLKNLNLAVLTFYLIMEQILAVTSA